MAYWNFMLRCAVLLTVTLAVMGETSPKFSPSLCRLATACDISQVMRKLSTLEVSIRKLSSKPAGRRGLHVFVKSLTWHQAVASCRTMGARLDAPRSAAEYNLVLNELRKKKSPAVLWLGASDIAKEGKFRYVVGGGLRYVKWSRGQPDNLGNEDCLEMRKSFGYLFNDYHCHRRNPSYLCRF